MTDQEKEKEIPLFPCAILIKKYSKRREELLYEIILQMFDEQIN